MCIRDRLASDKRFLIGLILIGCLSSQGYSQAIGSSDEGEVILPYSQEYLDQYNADLDKKAAKYNATFRSKSKAQAFDNGQKGNVVGACNLITCGSFEKDDVDGGTFRTAIGGTNGQYQADAKYTCWNDDGTVDWSEGQYISYSTTNSNSVYPGIIEPSTFDGGGFAIFSYQNEAIRQTLTVIPNTVYTVCFEIAVIPRYATVNSSNQGGGILEYAPNLQFGVRNGAVQITDPLTYTHNDLIQHPQSDFPTRLSFSTSGNNGDQNPGGWTEINPYWENRCITFKAGPSATSVEVFYKTGNPGRSVVLVDGLRLSVEGYANSPTVNPTSKEYCQPTQVALNTFVTSTTPPGAILKWTTNPDLTVTGDHLPNNPTVTTPGVWYAFYYNPALGCTSPSRKLTLTNTDLDSSYTKQNVTCFGGNDGSINLTVTGGSNSYTYSWTTSNGSGLNPTSQDQSGLTAGTYNVTVSDGTCATQETIVITQPNQINVDAGNYAPLCDNVSPITLTGTPTNSNGSWSGTGVTDNGNGTASFNPLGLTGSITVTYSYTDGNSCSNSDTADIMVNTAPTVEAGDYGPLCDNVSPITLTGTPTNSNGTWSGTGVTDNGNGTASFNPAGLSGSITVTYSYTDGNSCSNSDTANILVNTAPTVDAGNYGPLCDNVSPITLTGTPTNSNGTWSGTGVTDNGNGTASFNPAGLSGSITVSYSYTDGNSCSNSDTANILVNTAPTVDAGNYGPLCDNVSPITLTGTPTNSNGTWSGTGVTDNGNGTASFNPLGLTGSITVTYSYTDGNSCSNSDTANIMVNTAPSAPVSGGNQTECALDPIQTLTATATVPGGQSIVWYDFAVGGSVVTPTWNSIGSKTYYAEAVNNTTSCKSSTRTPVTLTLNNCGIILEKIASPNNPQGCTPIAPGEPISYTFKVSVPVGASPVYNVQLSDPLLEAPNPVVPIVYVSGDDGDGILEGGEEWIYTASYTVTQQNITNGQVQNTATVNGLVQTSGNPYPVSTSSSVTVNLCQDAEMSIVKSSTSATGDCINFEAGNTIDYKFVVTNEGDVDITNVVISDPLFLAPNPVVPIVLVSGDNGDGILNVGEVWTFNATYTITQNDIDTGSVINTAEVDGSSVLGTVDTATSNTVTVLICQSADIAIVKESDQVPGNNGCVELAEGDVITYTFRVTNEGNVSIDNVVVTDPLVGLSTITGPTGDTGSDGILGLNEIWEYTATYTVTQDDVDDGEVTNQATVNGLAMNPSNTPVSDDSHPTSTTADGDTVVVICQNPAIAIVKIGVFNDVDGNQCADAGIDTITYTFTVTNEGNVSLSGITVTDPLLQSPNPVVAIVYQSGDTDSDGNLDVTETWVYTATSYTITQDDIDTGNVTNQATATGTAPDQTVVEDLSGTEVDNDDQTVIELCQNPDIAIVKTGVFNDVDGNQCADAGIDTITYTFTVTNEGNVSLSGITVTDPLLQAPNPIVDIVFQGGDTDGDNELDVTETWIYTATSYTITQDDIDTGSVTNQATATGTAPDQTVVEDLSGTEVDNDDQTVIELCQNPDIAIVKTGVFNDENQNDCADVDETISYIFTVTNEGNVSLSNIVVDDPLLGGPIAGPDSGDTDGDNELDVTETWIYTGTYAITQDDIDAGEVINQATATGTAPDQTVVEDLSGSTTTTDDTTVIELCQNPAIAIVKTGIFNDENQNDCADVDETITYTFTVTNEGNVSLSNVVITDPLIATISGPTGDVDGDGELDVTEIWVYTGIYTINQDDIDLGLVKNQATAEGTAPDTTVVSDLSDESSVLEDDPTIVDLCQDPVIAIVKTGIFNDENQNDCADVDETISYTFTVTNEGNVSLSFVEVTDPLITTITGPTGDTDGDGELDVTETWIYTGTYAITQDDIDAGEVVNQASAKANDPMGNVVSDLSDESSVLEDDPTIVGLCQDPAIAIVKTGIFNDENQNDCADVDETISYTFTVTNEGNVSLSTVVVTDPLIATITGPTGDTDGDGELDVTETWIYTGTYAITQVDIDAGEVINQATAEGTAPDATIVSDLSDESSVLEDDPTVIELCQNPVIALIKTGVINDTNGNGCADVGETIEYSFTVFNVGNVTLTNITVADPLVTVAGGPITLEPGATDGTSFTAIYTITQTDIDAGFVENQATATGTDPSGNSVSDLSDDNSEFEDDPTLTELCQNPAIALIKVGVPNDENGNGCADLGETILYTFSVKNTGNVALTNVIVTDPLVSVVGGPINLAAGEEDTMTFTAVYTITQSDVDTGFIENQATAEGISPNGDSVSDQSDNNSYLENDPTVTDLCQNPSISLEKTGVFNDENGNGSADVGETISYAFTVTNTGNVTLYNIMITDPLPGVEISGGPIAQLEPGEVDSTTFTAIYIINDQDIGNGEVVNQATVTGEDIEGTIVEDDSDDPTDLTNNDNNGDGDPDDPTVVTLPFVLDTTFEIFNGITPNGDGLNDYFQIVGIENWPNNNVKIFNRWGVLVFETDGYGGSDGKQNVFRGISEGRTTVQKNEELPTGTYFYILTFPADNPGKADYTGYLYINR